MILSRTFSRFFDAERSGGLVLVLCTLVSLTIANSAGGAAYVGFWHTEIAGLTLEHWINDALMAVFFLLIGLELERELYVGELSDLRTALLPMMAAGGGVVLPAAIHFALNAGTPSQAGAGIPMATDIAFALGALALLGKAVPASLKVFLVAFAVMDDLAAVAVIAAFYTSDLALPYLVTALGVLAVLVALNRFRVLHLMPYLVGGILLWFLVLRSGVHATAAGVALAFAVPFAGRNDDEASPSHRLEHALHRPVAFFILPTFALANTAVVIGEGALASLATNHSLGVILGLLVGKPVGITVGAFVGVSLGLCRLPADLRWRHILGAGFLGGIGFTMSIFIANLAFPGDPDLVNASKMAVLLSSVAAGTLGLLWLRRRRSTGPDDRNPRAA